MSDHTIVIMQVSKTFFFVQLFCVFLPLLLKEEEYREELNRKDLHDPDNHDGVITHLEPYILECEVNCALESIIMTKAIGDSGIPVELFQIL